MDEQHLPWRTRRMILGAAVKMLVTGRHVYLSTGCIAGRHDYCASMRGAQGEKRPAQSKFSEARCICECHRGGASV